MHESFLGKNESVERILEPQHVECSPLENQSKTYENVLETQHVHKPYVNLGQSAFHKIA